MTSDKHPQRVALRFQDGWLIYVCGCRAAYRGWGPINRVDCAFEHPSKALRELLKSD